MPTELLHRHRHKYSPLPAFSLSLTEGICHRVASATTLAPISPHVTRSSINLTLLGLDIYIFMWRKQLPIVSKRDSNDDTRCKFTQLYISKTILK
jgi:hypothetical protein